MEKIQKYSVLRHPEKVKNPVNPILKKPKWIRVKAPNSKAFNTVRKLIKEKGLHTVCEEASCPNIGECWSAKHVTVMILGDTCTRACAFCNVATGKPNPVDFGEPHKIAESARELGTRHIVITSVDRDDLKDGGSKQFVNCIKALRNLTPMTTIEVLTPDFKGKQGALESIITAKPDIFNHNLETIERLYKQIRPGALYPHSLEILKKAKLQDPSIFTKSGIMVGLGETADEVITAMDDLRSSNVDFITIGQYLAPTSRHAAIKRFVTPEEFEQYRLIGLSKGFLLVASSPLTRSSYHADENFKELKKARLTKLEQGLRLRQNANAL